MSMSEKVEVNRAPVAPLPLDSSMWPHVDPILRQEADEELRNGTPWQQLAACTDLDPDIFSNTKKATEAQSHCMICVVRDNCYFDTIDSDDKPWGVRGGLKQAELRDHQRKARIAAKQLIKAAERKSI